MPRVPQGEVAADATRHAVNGYYGVLRVGGAEHRVVFDTSTAKTFLNSPECERCAVGFAPLASGPEVTVRAGTTAVTHRIGAGTIAVAEAPVDLFRDSHTPFPFALGLLTTATGMMPTLGLGAGPVDTGRDEAGQLVPFVEAYAAAHAIPQRFALTFCGARSPGSALRLGVRDADLPRDVVFLPRLDGQEDAVAGGRIDLVTADGDTRELGTLADTPTVIESGTMGLSLPREAYDRLLVALRESNDSLGEQAVAAELFAHPFVSVQPMTVEQLAAFPALVLSVGGHRFTVPADRYFKDVGSGRVLAVRPSTSGQNRLGLVFMEGRTVIFDRGASRIGIAPGDGACRAAQSDAPPIQGSAPLDASALFETQPWTRTRVSSEAAATPSANITPTPNCSKASIPNVSGMSCYAPCPGHPDSVPIVHDGNGGCSVEGFPGLTVTDHLDFASPDSPPECCTCPKYDPDNPILKMVNSKNNCTDLVKPNFCWAPCTGAVTVGFNLECTGEFLGWYAEQSSDRMNCCPAPDVPRGIACMQPEKLGAVCAQPARPYDCEAICAGLDREPYVCP